MLVAVGIDAVSGGQRLYLGRGCFAAKTGVSPERITLLSMMVAISKPPNLKR